MSLQVEIEKKLNDKVLSVSFDTEGKQGITGILGASGCGKSMTLKCIAGIETPDRGKIVLNGRVLFDSGKKINLRVQDRHVGYLFQNYALFPNMTVEENIAAGFKYRPGQKMTAEEIKKQTADYMELLHVTELKSSYPGKLSGGQQQRVALARILASDPEVLMLDEPFSALDAFLKEKLQLELLELLSGYDKDILMVTHSRDEIYRFCEHMLIVENGRQAGFGATKETMVLPNWNTTVCVKGMIPENTTHIGIRAHYLRLPENGQRENLVECQNGRILDDPFELVVVFEHDVWWKIPKESWQKEYQEKMPQYLVIPEESILYLHG
ncbi:MAG: ATP-binding cassette domain-containing protein [Roseburia sp.]|nr:ATP-binding cassette domain-containing protein [Roseburia sp.]